MSVLRLEKMTRLIGKWARRKGKLFPIMLVFVLSLGGIGIYLLVRPSHPTITKYSLAKALGSSTSFYRFPAEMDLPIDEETPSLYASEDAKIIKAKGTIQYAFDPKFQSDMENLFHSYKPDYGAFVAIDATSGRVLSMVSYSQKKNVQDNLTLRASFPSASIFKVVTAAAAIERNKYSANTVIPFNGRNHTLYRNDILKMKYNRWTRYITLKDAFAKSVNTVFGKIGVFSVSSEELRTYADRFGFNRTIASDMQIQEGRAIIPHDPKDPKDVWRLAETASGFTKDSTMSPLQGALIAAAIINDGVMMEPYLVRSVTGMDGKELYSVEPRVATVTVDPKTAAEIRALMKETVIRGTSRGSFRGFFRREFSELNVGGKTGSLSGNDPRGKYDWFVGFAEGGPHKIAIAALTVSEKYWRVKSSYLARRAIESYFKGRVNRSTVAEGRKIDF